ncbi:hypothetical protein [uncultured Tenacibaculum sp.]|uniref:hypothetical protein n=1 Tax=uncultured Tenacibaculum sp. TaxID=174713 RepID=UPI00261B4E2F|nr:hypothetical protein [uncultured Tenacibaculum sp.]
MIKKTIKIIVIIVVLFSVLILSLNYIAAGKIEKKLTETLVKKHINYTGKVKANVLLGNISIDDFFLEKDSIHLKINNLSVKGVSYYAYFIKDKLSIDKIVLNSSIIKGKIPKDIFNAKEKDTIHKKKRMPITIDELEIKNSALAIINDKNYPITIDNYRLKLTKLEYSKDLKTTIPFLYEKISLKLNAFDAQGSEIQSYSIANLKLEDNFLKLDSVKITPLKPRKNYIYHVPYEKDILDLFIKKIEVPKIKLTNKKKLLFTIDKILISDGDFGVYLDATVLNHRNKRKDLYSKSLRELPINFAIDSIKIKDTKITYEELTNKERKAGLVSFENIDAIVTNLTNVKIKDSIPTTIVKIKSDFMGTSPLSIDWRFNIADVNDAFTIKGKLYEVSSKNINSFIEPALDIKCEGKIDKLFFNFYGNDNFSNGDFAIAFKNLELKMLNKQKGVKKVVSWLANLFVKNSSKNKLEKVEIKNFERDQTRSFWNFLWKNVEEGLRKSLI